MIASSESVVSGQRLSEKGTGPLLTGNKNLRRNWRGPVPFSDSLSVSRRTRRSPHVLDQVSEGDQSADLARIPVRRGDPQVILQFHHEFDEVEGIQAQVL